MLKTLTLIFKKFILKGANPAQTLWATCSTAWLTLVWNCSCMHLCCLSSAPPSVSAVRIPFHHAWLWRACLCHFGNLLHVEGLSWGPPKPPFPQAEKAQFSLPPCRVRAPGHNCLGGLLLNVPYLLLYQRAQNWTCGHCFIGVIRQVSPLILLSHGRALWACCAVSFCWGMLLTQGRVSGPFPAELPPSQPLPRLCHDE